MTWMSPPPDTLPGTRDALQRVAVHVLARRRHAVAGRFGLRPSPGGLATPAFGGGDDLEVVRTCGHLLVVEHGAEAVAAPLRTLAGAAALAGADLTAAFSVGDDTPPVGDPDAALAVDDAAARAIGDWFAFGTVVIDEVVATSPVVAAATTRQVWPEHFDLGGAVTLAAAAPPADGSGDGDGAGLRANVGASPGDGFEPRPYLYLGPWGDERPGDARYWNAPFGAVLRAGEVQDLDVDAARARAVAFFRQGLDLLQRG